MSMKDRPPEFRRVQRDDPPRLAPGVPPPRPSIAPSPPKDTDQDQDHDEEGDD